MQSVINSIEGIDKEEMLDAFMVLADETVALLIQVFADAKEQNFAIMEGIDALRTETEKQIAQEETELIVSTMVLEDEVDRVLEENNE